MKMLNNKTLGLLLGGITLLFTACEEGDEIFDQIRDAEQRGAILRTINVTSDELPIGASDSFFGVEVEYQDQQDGDLLSALEVYVSFTDNTIAMGGSDKSKAETLAATIAASEFTIGEFGLPRTSYEITLPEMLSALALPDADVDGGDVFGIRFEIVMTDGRRFSNDDNSGTITGSYFSSPFLYNATVVCPPKPPAAGDWTIDMQDSYGDGWQTETSGGGAGLQLILEDGTILEAGLCSPYGSAAGTFLEEGAGTGCVPASYSAGTGTITVPAGAGISEWYWPGDFWGEISFQIYTPSGNLVADIPSGTAAGPIAINFCVD